MIATVLLLLVPVSAPPVPAPAGCFPAEKPIQGRSVEDWVADLGGTDATKQRAAYDVLLKAGQSAKGAVPALTKLLGEKNAPTGYIAEILGAIGPDAKSAVPALIAALPKDQGFGYGAETIARALAQIDAPKIEATRSLLLSQGKCVSILLTSSWTLRDYPAQVVEHLVTLCADKDAKVRENAALVLGLLKEKEASKVPTKSLYEQAGDAVKGIPAALEQLLADDNTEVRLAAARAITRVAPEVTDKALSAVVALALETAGTKKDMPRTTEVFYPVPEQAAKVLLPLFDHPNDRVRQWTVSQFTSLAIREPIEDALKNGKTARIRQTAAMVLGARYSNSLASAPALKDALKDADLGVRYSAAQALVQIGRRGSDLHAAAVPALIEGLQYQDEAVRIGASQYLLMTGPAAKDALPALKKLLDDEKSAVRIEAGIALVGIDVKQAGGAVSALTEGLKASEQTATRAAKALAQLGPVAKDAVPELVKHFGAKSPHLRLYAAEAVGCIDTDQAPKAVEVLVGLLKNEKYQMSMVRSYSLGGLRHIGPAAKPALPTLRGLLDDGEPFHVDVAIAMIAIDPTDKNPAFAWMRGVLGNERHDDNIDLVERLPELGTRGKPLIPDVVPLLRAKKPFHRENAVELLAAIGPDARDALPDLKKLAESDPRPNIRKLAAEAIKKIEAK
jgi:HEAT repeat protein